MGDVEEAGAPLSQLDEVFFPRFFLLFYLNSLLIEILFSLTYWKDIHHAAFSEMMQ